MGGGRCHRSVGSRSLLIKGERLLAEVAEVCVCVGGWGGGVKERCREQSEKRREPGSRDRGMERKEAEKRRGWWWRWWRGAQSFCHL